MSLDAEHEAIVRSLLEQNRKIEAIKLYRERTGVGLVEAKQAVERLESGNSPVHSDPQFGSLEAATQQQIDTLIANGRTIEAIKLYREVTGVGLKEAKDHVDAIIAGRRTAGEAPPGRKGTIDDPQRGGCLGILLIVAVPAGLLILRMTFM